MPFVFLFPLSQWLFEFLIEVLDSYRSHILFLSLNLTESIVYVSLVFFFKLEFLHIVLLKFSAFWDTLHWMGGDLFLYVCECSWGGYWCWMNVLMWFSNLEVWVRGHRFIAICVKINSWFVNIMTAHSVVLLLLLLQTILIQ